MIKIDLLNRSFLPTELKVFLLDYPRKDWNTHPNFPNFTQFWLQRHEMFRQLALHLIQLSQSILDNDIGEQEYQKQTLLISKFMFKELHSHHMMEDIYFFPGIVKYDGKLSRAIELLETDHREINIIINNYKGSLDRSSSPEEASNLASKLLESQSQFNKALKRHLEDEEDIIVPAALHYGFVQ